MFLQVIAFLGMLSFLVIIHELGHYLTARFWKVRVEEFGLGYPPRAKALFKRGMTVFSLNWVPFGGFVKMEGEETPEEGQAVSNKQLSGKEEGAFYQKSKRVRLAIISAGALVNFIFGVIAFSTFFSLTGIPEVSPRIKELLPGGPAEAIQLPTNVNILKIGVDGKEFEIHSVQEAVEIISTRPGQKITIVTTGPCQEEKCEGNIQSSTLTIKPKEADPAKGEVGIRFDTVVTQRFFPWYQMPFRGAWYGTQQAFFLSRLILEGLGDMFQTLLRGSLPKEVGSPVKIFVEGRKAGIFDQGPLIFLNFAGIISINLAIFNILPIPALDGGRAALILAEGIFGKKHINKWENYINYGGLIFLLSLMVVVFAKDILEVIRG